MVFPTTPYDAKGLRTLHLPSPTRLCSSKPRIYTWASSSAKKAFRRDNYEIPYGEPDIKRQGSDVTILTSVATL
jgi:2-oxoisovalerate dehydrogenase E1 component